MKNELTVLKALRQTILDHINDYLDSELTGITEDNVIIKWPNIDQMRNRVMYYIQPDYVEYEDLATTNDLAYFHVKVFIFCKRGPHRDLIEESYGYYNALNELMRRNMTLDGYVDFVGVNNADFYAAVDANDSITGTEVNLQIQYTKDFE